MITAKPETRRRLLTGRKTMPEAERHTADHAMWTALRDFLAQAVPRRAPIAAYRPFGAEPGASLQPELPERLAEDYEVLLPVTLADNDLDWTVVGTDLPGPIPAPDSGAALALTGPRGTEAVAATRGTGAIAGAAAVIVPALAVSAAGVRLGRGGGSYDRALARVSEGVPVVALLRDGEFGLEVPAEPHDRPVTAVITPSGGFEAVGAASPPIGMGLALRGAEC
ncbi:5-formyltetrahydrofolate cyclo-ligase [Glycomyces halotolerans]